MTEPWGYLERIGGSEDGTTVPPKIALHEAESFIGRFPEPVKSADSKFIHKIQTVIPCLFVSSTHFSIGKVKGQPNTFFIKDYSRNGTHLNQVLVGPNKTVEFNDGAEIALHYKNKVRINYRFRADAVPTKAVSPQKPVLSAVKEERGDDEESSRFASMRSQADSVEFALNKQIGVLQEESKQLEVRIQQQASRIESLTSDLHRTSEKNITLEKNVTSLEQDKVDLTDRLSTNESHCAAIEARNQKLVEQVEETKTELRDLRTKNTQLMEDLQTKIAQLESRNALMESSNKTMTHEKNKWTKLENKYSAACEQLTAAQEEISRVKLASQTLQDILSDRDAALQHARLRYDKLREVFEAGRGAVQRREEDVQLLQSKLSAAAQLLSSLSSGCEDLVAQSSYFDELAAGLEGQHEWSSQLSIRNEDTYAEGSYHSQLTGGNHSPSRTAATPEGVHAPPTATGTVNGTDTPTPSRHQQRARVQGQVQAGAQRLDIESEGCSQGSINNGGGAGGPARTADSQTQAQILLQSQAKSQAQSNSQSQGQGQGVRGSAKRKHSQQEGSGESQSSPKKAHSAAADQDRAVVLTRVPSAGNKEGREGADREEMDVQVEARDESSDDNKDDAEEGPEDMQATQAPANFSHLFEDSDQEVEEVEGDEGEGEGEKEGERELVDHEESVQVMEVVDLDAEDEGEKVGEVARNEVDVVELCSPLRNGHPTTATTMITEQTLSVPPKATSVTCTDDSASETSFDASGALLQQQGQGQGHGQAKAGRAAEAEGGADAEHEQEGQVSSSHSKPLQSLSQDEEF